MSRAAGARNAASPAPMNGRNPVGKKQRFQALQRPPAFGRLACAIAGPNGRPVIRPLLPQLNVCREASEEWLHQT